MEKIFDNSGCIYLKKKKKHVHIAFTKSISDYDCFDKILEFILEEWERRNFSLRVTNLSILDLKLLLNGVLIV